MRISFTLVVLLSLALGVRAQELKVSPERRKIAQEWNQKMGRGEGKLQPGDIAPDFLLKLLHTEQTVRLSDFRGKRPVALVFGSYT